MTLPTWRCTCSDGAYDWMLKKQWSVVFTWHTEWQYTIWKSHVELTQFPQNLTPSTSELHSIGPWFTRLYSQLSMKVSARCNLLPRLASTKWGAHFGVLQTSTTALTFVPADNCLPVWCGRAQQPSTGVRMHPIDTNLHALPVFRGITSWHP